VIELAGLHPTNEKIQFTQSPFKITRVEEAFKIVGENEDITGVNDREFSSRVKSASVKVAEANESNIELTPLKLDWGTKRRIDLRSTRGRWNESITDEVWNFTPTNNEVRWHINPVLRKGMIGCGKLNRGEASISISVGDMGKIMCTKSVAPRVNPLRFNSDNIRYRSPRYGGGLRRRSETAEHGNCPKTYQAGGGYWSRYRY